MNNPINFENAKLLKEKGFDLISNKSYRISVNPEKPLPTEPITDERTYFPNVKESYSAPTIAEFCMFLYKKHRIWIETQHCGTFNQFTFKICKLDDNNVKTEPHYEPKIGKGFNSPTEAYSEAIKYFLTELL